MIKIYQDLLLKWVEVYDQSEKNYSVNKEIRIMLRSDFYDFCDAYIVTKGTTTVTDSIMQR